VARSRAVAAEQEIPPAAHARWQVGATGERRAAWCGVRVPGRIDAIERSKSMSRTNPFMTDEEVAKHIAALNAIEQALRKMGQPLTKKQLRELSKPRKGSDRIIPTLARLAGEHRMDVSPTSPDDMVEQLALARRIQTLLSACEAVTRAARDTMLRAESTSWSAATLYYSLLNRVAKASPRLRAQMKAIIDFFSGRSAAVRKERHVARAERKANHASEKAAQATDRADAINASIADSPGGKGASVNGANGVHTAQ
jgi:hypothetical protein